MREITMKVCLKYDEKVWSPSDEEETWFLNDCLGNDLLLFSGLVGDVVGSIKVLEFGDN